MRLEVEIVCHNLVDHEVNEKLNKFVKIVLIQRVTLGNHIIWWNVELTMTYRVLFIQVMWFGNVFVVLWLLESRLSLTFVVFEDRVFLMILLFLRLLFFIRVNEKLRLSGVLLNKVSNWNLLFFFLLRFILQFSIMNHFLIGYELNRILRIVDRSFV